MCQSSGLFSMAKRSFCALPMSRMIPYLVSKSNARHDPNRSPPSPSWAFWQPEEAPVGRTLRAHAANPKRRSLRAAVLFLGVGRRWLQAGTRSHAARANPTCRGDGQGRSATHPTCVSVLLDPLAHSFIHSGLPAPSGRFESLQYVGVEADGSGHFARGTARPAATYRKPLAQFRQGATHDGAFPLIRFGGRVVRVRN